MEQEKIKIEQEEEKIFYEKYKKLFNECQTLISQKNQF